MKLRCERDALADALATAARATGGRSSSVSLPGGVQLRLAGDQLSVVGTDTELTIETSVTVSGLADGVCVVPGRLVLDIVRALPPGAVTLESDEEDARISSGRSQFSVRTSAEADLPRAQVAEGEPVELPAAAFGEALRQVVRAASSDVERPSLTGVLLEAENGGLRMVATDSYRLALRDLAGPLVLEEGRRVLLPARALSEVQRLIGAGGDRSIVVRIGELESTFEADPVRLSTRVLRAEFPNYEPLIPSSYPNRLVVSRDSLLDALRRVRLLVRDVTSAVRLTMHPDRVELVASAAEVGQAAEDIDASYEGAELMLAFNPNFLIDGVEAVVGDEVLVETVDPSKPAVIRAVDSLEYRYLLMPVRVS